MSGHEHLSEDALLDAVYGIAGNAAEAHLRRCADCAQRLHEWHEKRAASVESVEISSDFLAAQRKKIYRAHRAAFAQALAVGSGVSGGVCAGDRAFSCIIRLRKSSRRAHAEISDAQLFGEVYSMEQSLEPAAAAPARALFEEQQ